MTKLSPHDIQGLYRKQLELGQAPASVVKLHNILHRAPAQATKWGLVARNAADLVTPPRIWRKQMVTLSPDQARALLEVAKGDRLEALYGGAPGLDYRYEARGAAGPLLAQCGHGWRHPTGKGKPATRQRWFVPG